MRPWKEKFLSSSHTSFCTTRRFFSNLFFQAFARLDLRSSVPPSHCSLLIRLNWLIFLLLMIL